MSGTSQGQVTVATVAFETAPGVVDVGAPSSIGGVEVASFGADGIIVYRPDMVGTVILAGGSTVKGIRQIDAVGDTISQSLVPDHERQMLMLRAADGGAIIVLHESLDVTEPTERTTTSTGAPSAIGADSYQLFTAVNGGVRRWRCPQWAAHVGNPANYVTPPVFQSVAMARMEAALVTVIGGPIPD